MHLLYIHEGSMVVGRIISFPQSSLLKDDCGKLH